MTRTKFNWLTTLRRLARRKTPIGRREYFKLCVRADDWPDRACGQLCKQLPRDDSGAPTDKSLSYLGCDFGNAIDRRDWASALATFLKIEKRTAMLLRNGGKTK